jgi:hypothetical protein
MIQLTRNHYLVLNYPAEVFQTFDDVNKLAGWLVGKRTGHLVIAVVKGDRSRLFTVPQDLLGFRDVLLKTMTSL